MPRKKSPAQLDREIAEAIGRAPHRHHAAKRKLAPFPSLRVTKIRPERVDEWYGVGVEFRWVRPLDIEAYREAARNEADAWFAANPKKAHVGLFPLEKVMGDHIRTEITRSPQWIEFFSKPQGMPRFTARDIDNWDFEGQGGTASASTREGEE